jgi:hypothetical protein
MTKSFLGTNPPILELCVIVGVQAESVTLEGGSVTGVWADASHELIEVNSPLCEWFANWSDTSKRSSLSRKIRSSRADVTTTIKEKRHFPIQGGDRVTRN